MKRTIVKVLNWIAYMGECGLIGWLLGKLAGAILVRIGVNEEMAESHPRKVVILTVLVFLLVVSIPSIPIAFLLQVFHDGIGEGIDKYADDHEWD